MQNYVVDLVSPVSTSFRCQKAANSLDIDTKKKSRHHLSVAADLEAPYHVGLIVGSSGSGKTTLARQIFGDEAFQVALDLDRPVIDQFPKEMSYDDCASALTGMGLTSVPCWIRPAKTLSNGQRARAEAALLMARSGGLGIVCIDEWTSVVDRTVAKVMSHCVQKHARRTGSQLVLMSCHYDVTQWLNPDWIIDCNTGNYEDRRPMVGSAQRVDRLRFDVKACDKATWAGFSKYHYLSEKLPGGKIFTFGLFQGETQIGFICYAAYIIGDQRTFFPNRAVIHPDYVGLGLGIQLFDETAKVMVRRGYRVKATYSSTPVYRAMAKDPLWKLRQIKRPIRQGCIHEKNSGRVASLRSKTITYHFDFIWPSDN